MYRSRAWAAKPYLPLTLLAFAVGAIFLVWFSQNRLLALDEGFYVYAAKLALQGQMPSRDFFYPQTPLLPYIYAAWMSLWGVTWSAARMFSAVCAVLLAALVYVDVRVRNGPWIALLGFVLFTTSSLMFPWYTVVKAYPFAHLMLFLSWVLVRWPGRKSLPMTAAAGVCFGIAVGCRLYLVALAPVIVLVLWAGSAAGRDRSQTLIAFVLGCGLLLVGMLVIFAHEPAAFWFDNIGYHLDRLGYDNADRLDQKRNILLSLFGVSARRVYGRQFALLLWPVLGVAVWDVVRRRRADVNAAAIVILIVVSALPSPTYEQYFCVLAPFVICAFCALVHRARWINGRRAVVAAVVFLTVYLWNVPRDARRFFETGVDIPGMGGGGDVSEWRLESMRDVARAIDGLAAVGEPVLALWPGHLLESHASCFPGAENHFGPQAAEMIAPERARYHVLSYADMLDVLNEGKVRLFVARKKQRPLFIRQVSGLRLVESVGSIDIYTTGE